MYSALLRLPGGRKEASSKVKGLLKELGLEHVANSRIDEGSNDGISGGERRRVSTGLDLVHDPAVILIDEPTSWLDSASALHAVTLLKSMAVNQGKTIVLTIHQPGFRILELFDRIVLLLNGFVVHNGELILLEERLNFANHQISRHFNALEFAIDVIKSLAVPYPNPRSLTNINREDHRTLSPICLERKLLVYQNSRVDEVLILGQRFCSNIFRTKQLCATRVIQALVAGFILGTMLFVFLSTLYFLTRPRLVYLVNFACYKPEESRKCTKRMFVDQSQMTGTFTKDNLQFQRKTLQRSGLGDSTYLPHAILNIP